MKYFGIFYNKFFKNNYKSNFYGFTIIELIIAISVVATLTISAFLTIQKWISNARDSKRLSIINQIQKSLEINYIEKSKYPIPDRDNQNRIYIGTIDDDIELFYQGVIDKGVIQSLDSINQAPKDPLKENQNILYSISANQQQYQLAMTMEKNKHQALLAGNYDCFLSYKSGDQNYITNPPSLIYNYSGYNTSHHKINDSQMFYITDSGNNLPYSIDDENINNIVINNIFDNSHCAGPYITGVNIATHDKIGNVSISDISTKGIITQSLNLLKTVKYYSKINDVLGGFDEELKFGDKFGASVANIGDLDGDGIQDIAVGTYSSNYEETNDGIIYILFLDEDGITKSYKKISIATEIDEGDMFGSSIAGIGDLDGDGTNDIIVGSPMNDDGGLDRGAVYILFLNSDGTIKNWKKINYNTIGFTRQLADRDNFGSSVAEIGDLDRDGINEIAVGATEDDDGGINHGAVYIFFLDSDGEIKKYQKISETRGGFGKELFYGDRFGNSVSGIGDLNGDGIGDIAVGAYQCNDGGIDKGCVYLLYMDSNAKVKSYSTISETYGGFSGVLSGGDMFGSSVAGIGDLDGDGINDITVGAIGDDEDAKNNDNDGNDSGTIYLLFLNGNGTVKKYQKIGNKTGTFNSRLERKDYFGSSISNLGDLDNDGLIELLVGATGDDDGGINHGAVYILFLEL